ncbi:hypothetical protein UA08_06469 [Talaromyces atroroseus]|uniref:Nucleolar protein Dnt1-like N-terminal domain-containing protein n=1 Tax=Talaromyces atroroseus TaxID=1441469 RepID=A0A225ABD5_TALAT|nr:hypothetical protein UA08_06469 [Talaromyces atroroseus]OKL58262.1 hypothetical protein UA08_06469 [Talaromyces atroroseus]
MVFLRLTVKVLPRERLLEGSQSSKVTPSTTGNHDRNGVVVNGASTPGKPIILMVPVENPEEVTLGGLAGLIQDMWARLRPNSGPLEIKKILDADHPDENLDIQLTVADVFVQHGRAATDGQDQRAVALVIQKPTTQPIFDREGSVVQDWAGAAGRSYTSFKQRMQSLRRPESRIPTIDENEQLFKNADNGADKPDTEMEATLPPLIDVSPCDTPVKSVERDETEKPNERPESPHSWGESESIDDKSSLRGREASEELGVSPIHIRQQWTSQEDPFVNEGQENLITSEHCAPPEEVVDNGNEPVSEIQAADSQEKTPTLHAQPATKPQQNGDQIMKDDGEENAVFSDTDSDVEMVNSMPEPVPEKRKPGRRSVPIVLIEKKIDHGDQNVAAKRKRNSLGELPPAKELRLEPTHIPSTPLIQRTSTMEHQGTASLAPDMPPSFRRRPSFSSPQRPFDLADRPLNVPKDSMGLGITRSPKAHRSRTSNGKNEIHTEEARSMPPLSSTNFNPIVNQFVHATPSKSIEAPSFDSSSKLRSALRKTPPTDPSRSRRSVSFVENGANRDHSPSPTKMKSPAAAISIPSAAVSSPAPASSAPSSCKWPDSVSDAKILKIRKQIQMEKEGKLDSEQNSQTTPLNRGAEKCSRSKKKKKTLTPVSLNASEERPAPQLNNSPALPPVQKSPAPQPPSQQRSQIDLNKGVEKSTDSKKQKKARVSGPLDEKDAQPALQSNNSATPPVRQSPAPQPKKKSQTSDLNRRPEKGIETPLSVVSLNEGDTESAQLNKNTTPPLKKKCPAPQSQSQLKQNYSSTSLDKGAQSSTEHKKQKQTQIPVSRDSYDKDPASQLHKSPTPLQRSPAPQPLSQSQSNQGSQTPDHNKGAGNVIQHIKQKQTQTPVSLNARDKHLPPQSNKSAMPSVPKSPGLQSLLHSQLQSQPQSQSQSSEVSLPPIEKIRTGLEDRPHNNKESKKSVTKKITTTRTISAMETSEDMHALPDVPPTESPKSVLSQNSMATRQLHSELEIAGSNSPTKTESFPPPSDPVSSGAPLTAKPAKKPESSSSESSSESLSSSDSGDDIPAGSFAQRIATAPNTSYYFGAPNWNPVNANKRHTIQSVREELRKEMEAQAARDAEKAKANTQTNGTTKPKKPASTRKVDKELFDMTSSESDEDDETSSSESDSSDDDD